MAPRRSVRHLLATVAAAIVVIGGLVMAPLTVRAHTDFDYSLPTDGASVGVPVDEITVAFTSPVTLVGNGFAVLDPQNNELAPFAVTDDDTVFRLQFDPPLAGGTVAVKYEVRAADGHVLTGNFVFEVDAPVPTAAPTTSAPSVTTTPPTAATASTTEAPAASTSTVPPPPASSAPVPDADADVDVDVEEQTGETATATSVPGEIADDDGGSTNGVAIGGAAVVALAAGAFLLVRSRSST